MLHTYFVTVTWYVRYNPHYLTEFSDILFFRKRMCIEDVINEIRGMKSNHNNVEKAFVEIREAITFGDGNDNIDYSVSSMLVYADFQYFI